MGLINPSSGLPEWLNGQGVEGLDNLLTLRKDGADYEILWNAYHDGANYIAVEGAGSAEAFRMRFGNDGTTAKLIELSSAASLTAGGTITWSEAALQLGNGRIISLVGQDLTIETVAGRAVVINGKNNAEAWFLNLNGSPLLEGNNNGIVASRLIAPDQDNRALGGYGYNGKYWAGFFQEMHYAVRAAPNFTFAGFAAQYSKDITDAASAEVVGRDEDGVVIENGGKVLSRTVNHLDASTYNLYSVGTTEGLRIPTDTVCYFDLMITAINSGASVACAYRLTGVIVNDGGTTAFAGTGGTPSTTVVNTEDDANLSVTVVADDTNDRLQIQVSDSSGDAGQIKWKAVARLCIQQHS